MNTTGAARQIFAKSKKKSLQELHYPNVLLTSSTSKKISRQLTQLYFQVLLIVIKIIKLKKICEEKRLVMNKPALWILSFTKLKENVEVVVIPAGTTKYLQQNYVQTFNDYKVKYKQMCYLVSQTHLAYKW